MLVEHGLTRVQAGDGSEFTFRPSFGRIAALGSPHAIVGIYVGLHGPKAADEAAYVLACLCDQEDASALIGWRDADAMLEEQWHPGEMPATEQVILARHLMQHGVVGKARPGQPGAQGGKYAEAFNAADYIAAACVHLGMSEADAMALSMTSFQAMFEMKFPNATGRTTDLPTREEYRAARANYMAHRERQRG